MAISKLEGSWNYPTQIEMGAGRIDSLAEHCNALGMQAPLLVTDPELAALPMVDNALGLCTDAGLRVACFSGIKGNPTGGNINAGLEDCRAGQHDGVIAFGGGSALDAGKTIAMMAGQTGGLFEFVDEGDNWLGVKTEGMLPTVAVPTTAGTGSEVGRAAVITDEHEQLKKIIFHPQMLPQRVILDPQLTVGLPAHITAATGMDALAHNLEALCSPVFHPMAEGIALAGIRLVKEYLPRACADGTDLEARGQMLVASCMGATAFQRGLGGCHALAHPLGAVYDAHHGLLNAILLPYVLVANRVAIEPILEHAARYLGLQDASYQGFCDWLLELRQIVGIPGQLTEIGIDDSEAARIGSMAAVDSTAATNPIQFTAEQYSSVFSRACNGELVPA